MLRSKLGPLNLCLIAFGLMAFAAGPASAAEWLILNSKGEVKTAKELPAAIVGELEKGTDVTLTTKLVGVSIITLCTAITFTGFELQGGGVLSNGHLTLTGCTMVTPKECTVRSPGSAIGTIVSKELKGELKSNGELLIEP